MSARPCSFRLGDAGWALCTRVTAGPLRADAKAANALHTDAAFFLGPDDGHAGGGERVRVARGVTRTAFTTASGGFVHMGSADDAPLGIGRARHVAIALDRADARVVIADHEGLAHGPWPTEATLTAQAEGSLFARAPVTRADISVLEASLSGGRLLALYGLPDPVLGVCYLGPEGPRDVRLRLPAPVTHIDMEWVGEQVGVALLLEGGVTMACVLDARGSTRVKPYAVLGTRRDGVSPRVLWSERGFKVAAPCAEDQSLRLVEVGAPGESVVVVEGAPGPMDAVYFAQRYYFASVSVSESESAATLSLRSVGRDGGETQTLTCSLMPAEGSARIRRRALVARLAALESELRGVDYRSSGREGSAVRRDDARLWMVGELAVELSVRADEESDVLVVRWGRADPDADPPSFPRLRRWLGLARPPTEREEAQLEALRAVVPHRGERVLTEDASCAVEFDLDAFPSAPHLAGVLRRLVP